MSVHAVDLAAPAQRVAEHTVDLDDLFRRYSRELNDFAYRRLKDREAASDVVQDSFVRFLTWSQGRGKEERANSPRFFLWTVVGNLTLDLIRRNRKAPVQAWTPEAETVADPAPGADRWLEARQQYALVRAALDEMPPRYRAALLMNRVQGLTHAEIGVHFGVSASMVTKYVVAALEICASRLKSRRGLARPR